MVVTPVFNLQRPVAINKLTQQHKQYWVRLEVQLEGNTSSYTSCNEMKVWEVKLLIAKLQRSGRLESGYGMMERLWNTQS